MPASLSSQTDICKIPAYDSRRSPISILNKTIAGRYRPVRVADGPITARYRFIKNASWEKKKEEKETKRNNKQTNKQILNRTAVIILCTEGMNYMWRMCQIIVAGSYI